MGSSNPYRAPLMPTISLPEITITAKKVVRARGEYLGFRLRGAVNTKISSQLKEALLAYTGPEIGINSLRRNWNHKSKHYVGRAVDLEFSHELIVWLTSSEGSIWREKFGVIFYIEGKPGSRKVIPYYAEYPQYVLENPYATGDHIHIEI